MDSKIFNTTKTAEQYMEKNPLFFGDDPGLFNTLNKPYPKIWSLYKTMKSLDWSEDEFDYTQCNLDFKNCPKSVSDMMIKTLSWQWESDSVASKSVAPLLAPFISDSSLWAAWQRVSDNECVVAGTEVLTPSGWIKIDDVTMDTLVAQYNKDTRKITFVKPQHITKKEFSGDMIEFKNVKGHFHQLVTPGHRMIKTRRDVEFFVDTADKFRFDSGHDWNAISNGFFSGEGKSSLTDIEALYIAIQADGSVSDRYDGSIVGTIPIRFVLSKQRKIDRLFGIVNRLGFNIRETKSRPENGNIKATRNFYVDLPIKYNVGLKTFDIFTLEDKSVNWCKQFLEEVICWDGHYTKNTGILTTTNRKVAEFVQAVAIVSGHKTHFRFVPDNRKETYKDIYRITWKYNSNTTAQVIKKSYVPYNGYVYCVTVPDSFFVIRSNNAVSITGNCIHAATYSEIVRMSFDDPTKVMKDVLEVKESIARMDSVNEVFSKLHYASHNYALGNMTVEEAYDHVFMAVVALLILERIQFTSSFGITFTICSTNWFQSIGKAVQKIAQDELEVHVELDKEVIRTELKTVRGRDAYNRLKPRIKKVLDDVVDSELRWTEYLFSEGRELVGANCQLLKSWVLYNARDVYKFLEIDSDHKFPTKNPMPHMEDWINIGNTQAAPQEQDNNAYKVNTVVRNDSQTTFDIDF